MPRRQTAGGPTPGKVTAKRRQAHLTAVQAEIEDQHPEETLIARWVEQASTGMVLCRNFKHDFADDDLLRLYRINATYSVRELTCRRCGTTRSDIVVNGTLQVAKRKYEYPVGYQREKGADGTQALPRWAVGEALESRIDYLKPPDHIAELFVEWGRGQYR